MRKQLLLFGQVVLSQALGLSSGFKLKARFFSETWTDAGVHFFLSPVHLIHFSKYSLSF